MGQHTGVGGRRAVVGRRWLGRAAAGCAAWGLMAGAAAHVALWVPAAQAQEQVRAVQPHAVAVVSDGAALRCGDSTVFYEVATLKAGTVLRADGESGSWLRVSYPSGTRAFVWADQVQAGPGGRTVTLTRPSRLQAAHASAGAQGSYFALLDADLPTGTELSVIDAPTGSDGRVLGYMVAPPGQARAFIAKSVVRKATDAESAALAAVPAGTAPASAGTQPTAPALTGGGQGLPAGTQALAAAPTPTATPTPPTATPAPAPVPAEPAVTQLGPDGGAVTTDRRERPAPAFTPVPEGAPATTITPAPANSAPAESAPAIEPAPAVDPTPARRAGLQELVALFERVRQQPLAEAEIDTALAQFQSAQAQYAGVPGEERTAQRLGSLIELLRVRKQIRDELAQRQARTSELVSTRRAVRDKIDQLSRQRVYTLIGRLTPSVVYDGSRLPLLYRIQSPEAGPARTLGYLAPTPELDLAGKLGVVVGILGEQRVDQTLGSTIITARRVDVISLEPVSGLSNDTGLPVPTTPVRP